MATYIVLASCADQGIQYVKDTIKRAEAVREVAKKFGVTARESTERWERATSSSSSTRPMTRRRPRSP